MTLEIKVNREVPLAEEVHVGHNRWHPEIEPRLYCKSGDVVRLETRDALDGQVGPNSTSHTIAFNIDPSRVHPLTGPVFVEGAEPGDLLEVELLDIEHIDFGYTVAKPQFGYLRHHFHDHHLTKWDLTQNFATSEQIPGVRIPRDPFLGLVGVAPDYSLLRKATAREAEAFESGEFLEPPIEPKNALPEGIVATEGIRTGPPRENAGNIDIRQAAIGSKTFMRVFVEGALLSIGDVHYAQGDGEVCGQAIETWAGVTMRLTVHKNMGVEAKLNGPVIYRPSGIGVNPDEAGWVSVSGMNLGGKGTSESVTEATKSAVLNLVELLQAEGYSFPQAYTICSVAMHLNVSELVNAPNVLVTASLPLSIFEDGYFDRFRKHD